MRENCQKGLVASSETGIWLAIWAYGSVCHNVQTAHRTHPPSMDTESSLLERKLAERWSPEI
jgi:hypothetical protein